MYPYPHPHCSQNNFSKHHTAHVDALLNPSLVFFAFGIKVNSSTRPAQSGSSSHPHLQPYLGSRHTDYLLPPHLLYAFSYHRGFALAVLLPIPLGLLLLLAHVYAGFLFHLK